MFSTYARNASLVSFVLDEDPGCRADVGRGIAGDLGCGCMESRGEERNVTGGTGDCGTAALHRKKRANSWSDAGVRSLLAPHLLGCPRSRDVAVSNGLRGGLVELCDVRAGLCGGATVMHENVNDLGTTPRGSPGTVAEICGQTRILRC